MASLTEVGQSILTEGWHHSLGLGPGQYKKEKMCNVGIYRFLLPDCGCKVTSCFKPLLAWLPHQDELY